MPLALFYTVPNWADSMLGYNNLWNKIMLLLLPLKARESWIKLIFPMKHYSAEETSWNPVMLEKYIIYPPKCRPLAQLFP
jgi:hypothetical protein